MSPPSEAWTPNTTHQLSRGPLYYDILDHFFENGLDARTEVLDSTLLSNLQPARTTGDAQLQSILQLVGSMKEASLQTSRGDKNTFLTPQVRESEGFRRIHPHLSALLRTMESTVRTHLSDSSLELSNKVSVQLAVYPGDGVSGYPRHCDVSGACCDTAKTNNEQQRIVTAIYYLTPPDWSTKEDGGHLRLSLGGENYDAAPLFNRCIMFRSDKVLHQVLPSKRRDRVAVTVWFYGKQVRQEQQQLPVLKAPAVIPSTLSTRPQSETIPGPPPLTLAEEPDSTSTIFVSIASFRDSETLPTISALLETAQYPDRITVGLVWQYDPATDTAIPVSDPRIRCMTLHAKDARGPCYARRLAQLLYRNEDYILQIDSHMRFRRNWDTYLIEQLPPGKSLLTTYPVGYTLPNEIPDEVRPTLLVPWKFDDTGMLRQRGRLLKTISSAPIQTLLYAGGFNFGRGSSVKDCPYPTHEIFFGEEVYRAVQFHQQDYQLWAPPETVVYHLWSRNHRPVFTVRKEGGDEQKVRDYLDQNVSDESWTVMGVDWKKKLIFDGVTLGGLASEECFAGWADDSLEGKVASLEANAQVVIQSFLSQIKT